MRAAPRGHPAAKESHRTTALRNDEHEAAEHVISPELQDELRKHRGKWVAMDRERIIAIGDDPSKVLAAARHKGEAHPILYRVSEKDAAHFL